MTGLDEVSGEHGGYLPFNFGLLKMGVSVRSNVDQSRLGKVYMMLDVAVGWKLRGFCKNVGKFVKHRCNL